MDLFQRGCWVKKCVCVLGMGEASNVQAVLFHSALVWNVSFEGNLQVKWPYFWQFWEAFLLLEGYELWPNRRVKSACKRILPIRAATEIARRICIAELHAELEKTWSAAGPTAVAFLFHQLHPTSTAHCCSVSAVLWESSSCSQCRFTSRASDFSTLELCGAMSGLNYEVGEPLHNPSFPPITLLLLCSMQLWMHLLLSKHKLRIPTFSKPLSEDFFLLDIRRTVLTL